MNWERSGRIRACNEPKNKQNVIRMSDDDIMHLSLKMRKHVLEQGKSAGQDMMSDHDR